MFKKTALVAGIALSVSVAAQADYQWELGAGYSTGEFDIGDENPDNDAISGYGSYFINAVDDTKGPLAEAAFLDRASSISIFAENGNIDGDAIDDLGRKNYGMATHSVFSDAGWILDAGYTRVENDTLRTSLSGGQLPAFPGQRPLDTIDIDQFKLGFGKYLTDRTTLVLSYEYSDIDEAGDYSAYRIDLEHLFQFSFGDIKAEASYGLVDVSVDDTLLEDADDIDIYVAGATYYFGSNKNWGVGVNYGQEDFGGDSWKRVEANVSWFITDQWEVALDYSDGEFDDLDDVESKLATLSARFRF
jgi:hypothetical protein